MLLLHPFPVFGVTYYMFHAQYFALIILDYMPETVQISHMSILGLSPRLSPVVPTSDVPHIVTSLPLRQPWATATGGAFLGGRGKINGIKLCHSPSCLIQSKWLSVSPGANKTNEGEHIVTFDWD